MGELYNPFPKLPKNIRQMGERDDVVKLYVEDYVNTYLKRLYPTGGQDLRVGLLLGSVESHDGTPYIFIDGALEMEEVTAAGERVNFSEAAWKKAYQSIEETFPKRTVQGWFLCGAPGCNLSPLNYWKQHGQYFGGKNQLMYLNSGIDGDESLYITSDDGFYRLKGYCVYYERNQMMQDYMILRKDVKRVESGTNDRVIQDFRHRMEGRRQEALSKRGTIRTLGTVCSVLSVAILAGGVVMVNNYQKMQEMESVLVSVLPSGVKGWKEYEDGETGDKLIVEQIKGGVYPTQPDEQEETPLKQTMEEVQSNFRAAEETKGQQTDFLQADNQDSAILTDKVKPSEGEKPLSEAGTEKPNEASIKPEQDLEQAKPKEEEEAALSSSQESKEEEKKIPVTNMKPGKSYIVEEGETLYGICFKLYDSLEYLNDIRALNELADVDHIISGQKLILPDLSGES